MKKKYFVFIAFDEVLGGSIIKGEELFIELNTIESLVNLKSQIARSRSPRNSDILVASSESSH